MPTSFQVNKYYNYCIHIDDYNRCVHLKFRPGSYFGHCSLDMSRRKGACGRKCNRFKPSFKTRFRAAMDILHWRNIRKVD